MWKLLAICTLLTEVIFLLLAKGVCEANAHAYHLVIYLFVCMYATSYVIAMYT